MGAWGRSSIFLLIHVEELHVFLTTEINCYYYPYYFNHYSYLCIWVGAQGGCAYASWYIQMTEEGVGSPGAEVTGGCEPDTVLGAELQPSGRAASALTTGPTLPATCCF